MNQITVRQIPENLDILIRQLAKKQKKSINKTIIDLLEKALDVSRDCNKKRNLSQLSGTWSQEQFQEFQKDTAQFDTIDREVWEK